MNLKTKISGILRDAERMCQNCTGSENLKQELLAMLERLDEPLRVAVVGTMKAGKSTLMNALLQDPVLITGTVETTYAVSWFRYAETPSIKIVFKDGSEERAPFEDIERWTVRAKLDENRRLDDAKYIVIYYPNELLKKIELIDTPGLLSSYKTDSANTISFLGLEDEADQMTRSEASNADAVIFAFTRGLQQSNADLLESFHGSAAHMTPINAVGVLTQSDVFWDTQNEPLEVAQSVINNIMSESAVRQLLYTIKPVSAKLMEGAVKMSDEEWRTAAKLAELDTQILSDILTDKHIFCTYSAETLAEELELDDSYVNLFGSEEQRKTLCDYIGQHGISALCKALASGKTREECLESLENASGMDEVKRQVLNHFGNRSMLIKLQYVFTRLKQQCIAEKNRTIDCRFRDICDFLYNEIDMIETNEQSFRELEVLQDFYNGRIALRREEELEEILLLTGERGKSCEIRLGMKEGTPLSQLEQRSKEMAMTWNARANDFMASSNYSNAATVMARSCELMHHYLTELLGMNS